MKKNFVTTFFTVTCLAITSLFLTSCSSSGVGDTRTFTFVDSHPDGYPTVIGNREFARLVYERTNGDIKIDIFPNGVLGDEKTTLEQVQFGGLEFIRITSSMLASLDPSLNVLSLPYMYESREAMFEVLDGEVGDYYREKLKDIGMIGLAWVDPGSRSFYNTRREITSPADLNGLKIRVQETKLMVDLINLLGGSPTPMSMGEVYSSLQTGVIDGAENNFPSYVSSSHHEVAQYYTINEHTTSPEIIVMNLRAFESLTEEQQQIILEAAKDAALVQRTEWLKQEKEAEEIAIASGAKITRLTDEQRQAFADVVLPIYDDYSQYREDIERIRNAQGGK